MFDVPGIVFMRGGAVGVMVILECEGKEYVAHTACVSGIYIKYTTHALRSILRTLELLL